MKKLFILLVCVFKYTLTLKGDFELKQLGEKEYLLLKGIQFLFILYNRSFVYFTIYHHYKILN